MLNLKDFEIHSYMKIFDCLAAIILVVLILGCMQPAKEDPAAKISRDYFAELSVYFLLKCPGCDSSLRKGYVLAHQISLDSAISFNRRINNCKFQDSECDCIQAIISEGVNLKK